MHYIQMHVITFIKCTHYIQRMQTKMISILQYKKNTEAKNNSLLIMVSPGFSFLKKLCIIALNWLKDALHW